MRQLNAIAKFRQGHSLFQTSAVCWRDVTSEAEQLPIRSNRLAKWVGADDSYVLVSQLILRSLALIYAMAFLVAALQGPALIGENGLLPTPEFLTRVQDNLGSAEAWMRVPTLFWFGYSDALYLTMAWLGFAGSIVALLGVTNAGLQLLLWLLYSCIANVGQRFWGYGWEMQLLESGALAIFLCPLRGWRPGSKSPPFAAILLQRWLIARVMLGAGLIKLRGDDCWTELTCLDYHFETQPIPNPLTPWFHAAPSWVLHSGVVMNHAVELLAPLLAFGPRWARLAAGVSFVVFQLTLIASGNLSFLNWLTIIPALACFDDRFFRSLASAPKKLCAPLWPVRLARRWIRRWIRRCQALSFRCSAFGWSAGNAQEPSKRHRRAANGYAFLVAVLSLNPILNLVSSRQAMNTSFDPLRLVNTYGAFGSVGKERYEVIIEGANEPQPGEKTQWLAYEFPCKPGDVGRRPCWMSPYHYRLAWQLWFAGFGSPQRERWIIALTYKLLTNPRDVESLIEHNPFGESPPKWVRITRYRYKLEPPQLPPHVGPYWSREPLGTYLRPMSADDPELLSVVRRMKWK